jgi:predicted nucleic acid-binding protein
VIPATVRLVVDANVLVGELLRGRGRRLLNDARVELFIAARALNEFEHGLGRRVVALQQRRELPDGAEELLLAFLNLVYRRVAVLPQSAYDEFEAAARRRIPRDPDDWHAVGLALALDAGIWTRDGDFLGCGIATRTTETLLGFLEHEAPPLAADSP